MKALQRLFERIQAFVGNRDPLVEEANWVAFTVGTHLPLWPLYIWWAAGPQAWPTSIWTITSTPFFLAVPFISRRDGYWGRVAMVVVGTGNTVLTRWVLGPGCGTELFYAPCAVLGAILFRRSERWSMIILSSLPLFVFTVASGYSGSGLHHYDEKSAHGIFTLNLISVSVLVTAYGWLQGLSYKRMET